MSLRGVANVVEALVGVAVIVFVVLLFTNSPTAPPAAAPAAVAAAGGIDGALIFGERCAGCHGGDGSGGIGPRLAQVILSGISTEDLAEAIMRVDSRRLSAIPGVGKKTSERICLELRDKLVLTGEKAEAPRAQRPTGIDDDVVSALVNLGYKAAAAQTAVAAAREQIEGEPEFPILLRAALRQLNKRG